MIQQIITLSLIFTCYHTHYGTGDVGVAVFSKQNTLNSFMAVYFKNGWPTITKY